MRLPFIDRERERARLLKAFAASEGTFCCISGRRRCGKSRLLAESVPAGRTAFYVGDEREPELQRSAMAEAIADLLPGFQDVHYPDWDTLLRRWWGDAPEGGVLVIDEFPYLATTSPELPSIVQRFVDRQVSRPVHLVLCGSSQRMMQGLVLDARAPLYGRAREIIEVKPLEPGWLSHAFPGLASEQQVEAYATWGGVPRYWELACDYASTHEALLHLVLDPMGVLHREPGRLLSDDLRDVVQASSILALVGAGCSRFSEIAARLGKPVTSLTRPMRRLLDLGLVRKEVPFGVDPKSSKKTLYAIADPFLAMWYRYLEPNRSRLELGALNSVRAAVEKDYPNHVGRAWEDLVRRAIPRLRVAGCDWGLARRWWGNDRDGNQVEIDAMAESADGTALLVAEAKLTMRAADCERQSRRLRERLSRLPLVEKYSTLVPVLFAAKTDLSSCPGNGLCTADDVLRALR